MLKRSVNPDLSGKKKVDSKKSALVVVAIIFLLSALSVWCVIPKDVVKSALEARIYDTNVECLAQGDYMPKPFDNTALTLTQDDNKMNLLCSGQGGYFPKPDPDDTTNTKITPVIPDSYETEINILCSIEDEY
ncbi:MAG: hypothetical protein KAW92_07500 [Candidatus Cloacimonetes bacterium]|nr:hypothetical protein [Candidatus Cloacimonadota bacterium]